MEIIIYSPKRKYLQEELSKRVATIHAQAILDKVRELPCPVYQKVALIEAVQDLIKRDIAQGLKWEEANL